MAKLGVIFFQEKFINKVKIVKLFTRDSTTTHLASPLLSNEFDCQDKSTRPMVARLNPLKNLKAE